MPEGILMLKVLVITQQSDGQYWNESFSNVWEGPVDISLQKDLQDVKDIDLIILDFSSWPIDAHEVLADVTPHLADKHFLIVSDHKDADLAIEAIRLGAIGFLVKPFKRSDFISSLDRLHSSPKAHLPTRKLAKVITLLSYKGGTGVSTATVNLGFALANIYSKKTLIIDAAGFSNHVTVLLNVIPKCTLADLCKQGKNLDEQYLSNAVSVASKNLNIIGGLIKTSELADLNTPSLEHIMEIASEMYDFILVDTSCHLLDEVTMFFIQKANDLLLLTTFDLLAIRDNRFYIQTLKEIGILEHRIKPVINRQDWYIGSLEPGLVQKQLNHAIFHSLPNDWELCVEAANYGRPLLEFSPNSKLATSYQILAGKISKSDMPLHETVIQEKKQQTTTEEKSSKKKGILNWF